MPDPTLTFDLVHVELGLGELLDLARRGLEMFEQGFALLRTGFCALPFVRAC